MPGRISGAGVDGFDAGYFGISPREAHQVDPQQRLLLEVTWEALWDAGIDPGDLAGSDAGVFAAIYNNDYARLHFQDTSSLTAHAGIGTAHSVAAGRLSFLLNLKGPSLAIDSACSSSLVAIHLACQSLRAQECGMAIVGASSLKLLSDEVLVFSKWGMLASDGRCKTFDASADGFVPGEGSGAVILKRLSDALADGDRVRAVIRGTAVNHDGKTSVLTAPNGLAQEAVIRAALKNAKLQPQDVTYIETHGTGTSLGDPIEIEALNAVYGDVEPEVTAACILGAVKTNLGHLEAAAGMAGLIKAVLCLEHGEIPRNLHFRELNPQISLTGSRLKIPAENLAWTRGSAPRAAGISSFGLGGTNAHVIVEEAPLLPARDAAEAGRPIPLPAYRWQRQRFWLVETPRQKANSSASLPAGNSVHPLLGGLVDSPFVKGRLFESDLNTDATPYLAEHRLGDRPIMPFAAFLELAAAAIREVSGPAAVSIRDFMVREPRFLSSASCRVQVLAGDGSIEIASESESGWTTNATSSFQPIQPEAGSIALAGIKARCREEISPSDIYQRLERTGLQYGAAFRAIQSVSSGQRAAIALLRLPEDLRDEAKDYGLHPVLLDGCLQTVAAARNAANDDLFLPISVDRFDLQRTGAAEVWVYTEIVVSSAETLSANLVVTDMSGSIVARLTGFRAKRATGLQTKQFAASEAAAVYELAWRSSPSPDRVVTSRSGEHWLLIEGKEGSCSSLARALSQQGASCEIARSIEACRPAPARGSWTGVVYDSRGMEADREDMEWQHRERDAVDFIFNFVKSLENSSTVIPPRLWIVSSSVVAVLPGEDVSVAQAPLWGLVRTLALEHPETSPVSIDAGCESMAADTERMLAEEIAAGGLEPLVAFRNGTRYTARLIHSAAEPGKVQRLKIDVPGRLEDLHLEPTSRRDPTSHEVEIMVRATGLNFRDVLTALGMFGGRDPRLGAECSGTIVRVGSDVRGWKAGDNVLAFAPSGFQTFVNVAADFVTRKPAAMTFAEAAGIPIAFLTAHYGLNRLAKLSTGQRILIHAAAGGLGLAAVQLAIRAGAQVFATAGSPEKWAYLKKLGVERIFDSRSLAFRSEVLEATGGAGVDVVLNSLAGEFIRASLDVVARGGCFLEVGKRDLLTREDVVALRSDVRYFPFDLGEVAVENPKLIAAMLGELMESFSAGELQPLRTALYSLEDSVHAFRTMAQARHIGKIVLGHRGGEHNGDERLAKIREIFSQGTVLITGGLGALGVELARWLAGQGARNIVLAGRGAGSIDVHPIAAELQQSGVDVAVERVDVASSDQLQNLLDKIRATRPPLRAVFHAAGVVHDSVLGKESWNSFCETTDPKIAGAWNLHRLTQNDPIGLMVFFSSAASILGSPGQGSYAAGNAFLDALAHHRAACGLAMLSLNWGAWASAGMAARLTPEQMARWTRQGAKPMPPAAALAALQTAMKSGRAQVAVMDMDWKHFVNAKPARVDLALFAELLERGDRPIGKARAGTDILEKIRSATEGDRKLILSAHIKDCARRVLGLDGPAAISGGIPLQDLGLDSLMALEMRNELSQSLGVALSAGLLFDYPAVDDLAKHLLGILAFTQSTVESAIASDADDSIRALHSLSEEEAELLLMQELDAGTEKANA